VIETIDARCDLVRPPLGVDRWDFRRSATGAKSWTLPREERPDGVSLLSVSLTPAGDLRCRVEANLTTLYAGTPHAAVASLTAEEVPGAVDALAGTVQEVLGNSPAPEPHRWDVHRLDPSTTLVLPDAVPATTVVRGLRDAWSLTRRKDSTLSAHNDQTVTLRLSKHRSWTAYDKAAEAAGKANPLRLPPNLLRLEARLRPRQAKNALHGEWNPTLALTKDDLGMVENELDAMTEALAQVSAAQGLMTVRALIRGGATVNEAMRLNTVATLVAAYGPAVLTELGAAQSTADRWRADVKRYLAASADEGDALAGIEADLPTVVRMAARLTLADALRDEDR